MRFIKMLIIAFWPSLSLAQQAIEIQTSRVAQLGYGEPSITFKPNVSGRLGVQLGCGPKQYQMETSITPGISETLPFEGLGVGTYQCTGAVQLTAEDGSTGEMPLHLEIQMLTPLTLSVSPEQLDIENKTLRVQASRPLGRVKIELRGFKASGGVVGGVVGAKATDETSSPPTFPLGSTETSITGMTEAEIQWTQSDDADEILQIVVTGWDQQDFPGQVVLSPWSYAIPHEDVIFRTGSSGIDPVQAPKLQEAYEQLQSVLKKYGEIVVVQLYVAGYTDSVGSEVANQALSTDRAASIASWFKDVGFTGAIFYQGFGEAALAIPSGDETPEQRNRRAVYILAASTPQITDEIPTDRWTSLQ